MALLDLRLREFLDEVSAEGKTPGAGSVAALVTAAAAGLLAKVARASPEWPDAPGVAAQAESLLERAAPLAEVDAQEYEAALGAREEAGGESSERRDYAVGRAYARAAEPPFQIVEAAADVAQLAVTVVRNGDPSLRADAAAAGVLAAAAARAAAELVAVNLTASEDDPRVVRARTLVDDAARASEEAFASGGI